MTKTFRIKLHTNTTYEILNQPTRDFNYRIGDIFVASASFPCADISNIYLQGGAYNRDDWIVKLYPNHLKTLEELCRRQHWRFIICMS